MIEKNVLKRGILCLLIILAILVLIFEPLTFVEWWEGIYNKGDDSKKIEHGVENKKFSGFVFPEDEGKHDSRFESWFFSFYVESQEGVKYSGSILYYLREDRIFRKIGFTNLSDGSFYSHQDNYPLREVKIKENRLYIKVNTEEGLDLWHQKEKENYEYNLSSEFNKENKDIKLNFSLKSLKGPTFGKKLELWNSPTISPYYYDHTNIKVEGVISRGKNASAVNGNGYISREWGKELTKNWDWFAIQFKDNYEIISFKTNKGKKTINRGWIINPCGDVETISDLDINVKENINLKPNFTKSWSFISEEKDLDLRIRIKNENQFIGNYFEGSCKVTGKLYGEDVEGICFSEQL